MHQREAGRVPEFVDEMAVAFHPLFAHLHVAPLGGEGGQGETEGVGAVLFDDVERIDDVALGLAHLLPLFVAHQGVHVDVGEGDLLHEVDAHHHHAGDPEKKDVEAGHQHRRGIVGLEQRRLVRPAHGGKRPQGRTEPGVEDVGLLHQVGRSAVRAGVRRLHGHDHAAAPLAGPGRNLVAPPDLARDAPVADVVHPFVVGLGPRFGDDAGLARLHRRDGFFGQGLGSDEPLA